MSAFLFPGQGSQKPGMGADFYESCPAARETLDVAASQMPEGFLDTLFHGEADAVNDTRFAQPALLAVEVAITRVLRERGLSPSACAGHSLGEIPALVACGTLAYEDALPLVRERARLMSENVPAGGMAAVMGIEPDAIAAALPEGVNIANYNSPAQIIISGSAEALEAAATALKEAGAKRVMPLKVSGPFHSPYMRPAAEAFAACLSSIALQAPSCRFISSVSGQPESDPERIRALLAEQLTSPVRWMDVMRHIDMPCIEIGPGGVLAGLAKRIEGAPAVTPLATTGDLPPVD
ncbi:MAG: S-malonyltransferase [Candidatus Hydrogenedentota bacterium]|jgi:[acyl-carrier-protein] S-malonyltransferase